MKPEPKYIQYSTVKSFFLQDEPSVDPAAFEYTAVNFGLIDRDYETDAGYDPYHEKTQWQRFDQFVSRLNSHENFNMRYKLLYLGRHGEGVHNVAESFYSTSTWDSHWSKLEGNSTATWVDAHLTGKGEQQARTANKFWTDEITNQKIPLPESYYTSPLDRCLATANITFSDLPLPTLQPFIPVVKELLRETNGVHTCDRRSSKTYIKTSFPTYTIESGFSEEDELWSPNIRETDKAQDIRLKHLLDDIFTHDESTYISLTSHSGAISAMLRVVGHRKFRLRTGAVIPVLVKAEKLYAQPSNGSNDVSAPASN